MNKITIELCEEDRARLDGISNLLLMALKNNWNPKDNVTEPDKLATTEQAPTEEAPEPATPEPTEAEKPAEVAPEVSAAELQSKVVQLVSAGKKEEARTIVMEYAKSVSEIPADKRAEVLKRLNALEG